MRINLNNFLLTSCSGLAIALTSALNAHALPTGGQIESGSATITQTDASNLVIDQHTDRAVINWTNFDILRGETTRFNQLSSSSIALNRVTDGNPTQILGNLSANGRVFIVNPSGVVFGAGSRVDVAGLVATTANITTHDFLAGHMRFNHAGRPDARIINQGNITARDGGLVALVAPYVENSGVIAARMGTVAIGAAKTVTLDLYGDNLYGFKLGEQADAQGSGVKNTGEISAQGGRVLISAKTAQDVVNQAINLEGVVDATSMREVNGEIIIDGGEGSVRVAGMLNASGKNAGEKGGRVQVTGKKIALASATVDASGYNGGGEVRIGGDKKGGGTIARADYVNVDSASLIDVSATNNGNGGSSVVWSDIATNFYGRLRGRGGENGGNGGFAEVSSKNDLTYNGAANLGATNGRGGQMLLDPLNIIIDALTAASIVGDLNTGTDVIVETNVVGPDAGDITIDAAMNWTGIGSLIFNAMNDIIMNASIGNTSATGGNVTFNAGNDGAGNLAINNGANIDIAGALTLNAAGGTVSIADADLSATDITVNATLNYIGTAGATRQIRAGAGTFTLAAGAPMDIGDRHVNIVADNITIESTINGAGGSVYVRGHDVNRSMGLAGGVGDLQIDVSELDLLSAVSNQIYGNANGVGFTSGDIDVAARNWAGHGLTIVTTGKLTISGAQNYSDMNYLSLGASDYDIAANLTSVFGTSNSLLFNFTGALMTMGGAADIINTAELNLIDDGFTSIQFGAGAISNVTVNAYNNWRDPVQFTNAGTLTVSGAQAAEAASNASVRFANGGLTTINQNVDFSGSSTGGISFAGSLLHTVNLGANLISGVDGLTIDRAVNLLGAAGATRVLNAGTGAITMNNDGVSTFGAIAANDKNLVLNADNMEIGGNISGTALLYFAPHTAGRTMGLAGGAGSLQLSTAELDRIQPGFADIYFGLNPHGVMGITGGHRAGALNIGARNWGTPGQYLFFGSQADITASGNQNFGNTRTTFMSLNTDYRILANLAGTNLLHFRNSGIGTDLSIGGAAGTTDLDTAELNRIQDGFAGIVFGDGSAGSITFHAYNNWRDAIDVLGAGANSVIGTQTAAAGSNASIRFINLAGSTLDINADVDFSASSTGGVHLMYYGAGANPVNLAANLLSGIDGISIDRAVNLVGAAGTTRVLNANTGTLSINNNAVTTFGSINAGAANLTLIADNIDMTGGINGTATTSLRIREFTAGRTMGLAGGAGDLNLSNAELDLIAPNLFAVVYGSTTSTGAIEIGARNWQPMNWAHIFYANAPITVSGAQTFAPGTNVFYDGQDYIINANISGNSIVGFGNRNVAGLTVGGAVGTTMLDSAELDRLQDGFSIINIGGGNANNITMQAYNNWRDAVRLGGAGTNTIAGVQRAAAGSNASFEVAHGSTNINANLDFSGSTTGGILLSRFASNVVNLGANLLSGIDGITIDRAVNLVGAMGTTRTLNADAGNVTINNNGGVGPAGTLGGITGTGQNLRADSAGFTLNGATINTAGGNIDIHNTGVFFSSLPNSLNTGGAGRIYVQQNVGGLIQNAVDAVGTQGTGGATVQAGAGVFEEHVNVGKNLTLRGTLDGVGNRLTTITSPTILAVNFTDNADNRGIIYGHDANITIRDFIIDGLSRGNGNSRFTGVLLQNALGSVTNNFITNIQDNPFSGNQGGTGIYVSNMDSVARDLTVSNNTINNFQKNGITVKGNGLFATITGNIVTGIGATAIIGQNGIQIGGSIGGPLVAGANATGVISGNTISGIGFITTPGITSGVLVTNAGNNVSVTGNTINGTGFDNAVLVDSTNGALVSENVIGNIAGSLHGVRVTASNNTTLNLNVISNSANSGILLDTVGVTTVTNNTTNANGVGISVFNTDNFTLGGSNVISNNTVGVLFNNSDNGTYELDALDIAAGGTGLRLENGSGNFIVRDVVFNGGETAVLIDGAASNMQFDSNGSFFNGNNFYFVLQNGAMAGETLIATQQTFDGTRGISFNLAQRNAAEAKTIDVEDGFGVGNVFYRDFSFEVLDQLAQQKSNVFGGDVFSYNGFTLDNNIQLNNYQFDITSLDLSLLNTAAGGRGASPADLNNLTTAGNDENASAAQLNDLETAAGGDENGCGNSYLGSGAEFGFRNESCLKSDAI